MKIKRIFTQANKSVFDMFEYSTRTSILRNTNGSVVFEMNNIEVPKNWSQVATDILAQKYFRKAGVPITNGKGEAVLDKDGQPQYGSEHSIKQVAHRLAGCWAYWGREHNYFDKEEDANAFYDEVAYMLMAQMVAPNSPQWFNTGLNFAYGITGNPQGHYYVDGKTHKLNRSKDAYTRPAPHACFIQSVNDDLVNEGGIFDLVTREARIFKYGSGTGTNFSAIRGTNEPLSGGGQSSGLMSFLKVNDRAAGAVKSGGTTRRAAKMVILNIDHPDIEEFITWKMKEEQKVAALVAGSKICNKFLNKIIEVALNEGTDYSNKNSALNKVIQQALNRGVPLNYIVRVLTLVEQGETRIDFREFDTHYEGEAYNTVSGQNSNNSVRVTNAFMRSVEEDDNWHLTQRTDGKTTKTLKARSLWDKINYSAWSSADPGLQFDTTINEWHTCINDGTINGSNPCSEYMFLDDTACNLASINLAHFYDWENRTFKVEEYKHSIRLWTCVLEISVLMAQFPSKEVAQKSFDYRTLGLGYANLGTVLMTAGIPYDSEEGRAWAAAITAILTGESYATSAEMAKDHGPFARYKANSENMLRVIRNHRRAAYNAPTQEYEGLTILPQGINQNLCPSNLATSAKECWDRALSLGQKYGYRNAQTTVLAPTGCLTGNSMVSSSFGLVPLNTLGNINGEKWQDANFEVMTNEGVKQATKFFVNGVAPTRNIKTKLGYEIYGTLQHRIKVLDSLTNELVWKRFSEIKKGDALPLAMNTIFGDENEVALPNIFCKNSIIETKIKAPKQVNSELAELVGYFAGKGFVTNNSINFNVLNSNTEVAERLVFLIKKLFNIKATQEQNSDSILVQINSVEALNWWVECGFAKLNTPQNELENKFEGNVVIPNSILFTNSKAVYTAYLRGLFEANATLSNGVPCFANTDYSFVMQVKSMLLAMGIVTNFEQVALDNSKENSYKLNFADISYNQKFLQDIRFISNQKNSELSLSINVLYRKQGNSYVSGELVSSGVQKINEQNSQNFSYNSYLKSGNSIRNSNATDLNLPNRTDEISYYYDIVEINQDGGEQHTYDISVPENVTYLANGFISHNTIGLVMDCDTTGVEPDFAIVKFKKLAGGGYFKIVNQSVSKALQVLGYTTEQINTIEKYCKGHGTLVGCPHINRLSLKERGFNDEKIQAIEGQLDSVFDIKFAFNKWTLGEDFLQELGFTAEQYDDFTFNLLEEIGFTKNQIEEANNFICGLMTIENAPGLRSEHLPVFDCANKCGKFGKRFIEYMGHVKMMAATQPFITGAISKTINMPNEATLIDVENVHLQSWKLMIKAIALYRDGSKLSQPLNSVSDNGLVDEVTLYDMIGDENNWNENVGAVEINNRIVEKVYHRAERRRLPKRRHGFVREATVGGHKVFIRTGEYEDGSLGEIFIDMYKEGASFKGLMNCFAVLASKALQYGMPIEKMVDTFTFTRFEPAGAVFGHEAIKNATSIIDYVFRAIGYEYLGREDFIHVKAVDENANTQNSENTNLSGKLSPGQELYVKHKKTENGTNGNKSNGNAKLQMSAKPDETVILSEPRRSVKSDKTTIAKTQGYTGEQCSNCSSMRVKQNGACHVCEDCGTTSGCS